MIARETARLIARLVTSSFTKLYESSSYGGRRIRYTYSNASEVYDFLFDHEFPVWLCNAARTACSTTSTRPLQDFLMKLHTGEAQYSATPDWTWAQREKLGQQYLQQLAEAILGHWSAGDSRYMPGGIDSLTTGVRNRLELDGYTFAGTTLLAPEEDALDAEEEAGALQRLYGDLHLGASETAMHHLRLSEEHYLAGRWDDSIGNSRKFLECVLCEVARRHSMVNRSETLAEGVASRPARVRDYLESAGLIETQEKKTLASIYGLLSETGGHPYMAQNEQARLLRHLALTLSQFVMLRFRGSVASSQ
jgi:hypothetical protein